MSLLVTAVMFLVVLSDSAAADAVCHYKYAEHLREAPICSPYENGIMRLECSVEVPLNATDITIGWFLDCQQLTNDSHVTISSQVHQTTEVHRVRSQLVINYITDDFAGEYTCNILGDEEYVPSNPFRLRDAEYLDEVSALGPCPEGGDIFYNAVPAPEKCAQITEDNPIPMSLICEAPPTTSSQSLPTISTPVLFSSSSASLLSLTSSNVHHSSTMIHSPSHTAATPNPTDTNDNNVTPTVLNTLSLSLIAVSSLLLMVIILFTSLLLAMWYKKQKHTGSVNLHCSGPSEEPYYDTVGSGLPAGGSVSSSAVISQSNPVYEGKPTGYAFDMDDNTSYDTAGTGANQTIVRQTHLHPKAGSGEVSGDVFHMNTNSGYGLTGQIDSTQPPTENSTTNRGTLV